MFMEIALSGYQIKMADVYIACMTTVSSSYLQNHKAANYQVVIRNELIYYLGVF